MGEVKLDPVSRLDVIRNSESGEDMPWNLGVIGGAGYDEFGGQGSCLTEAKWSLRTKPTG